MNTPIGNPVSDTQPPTVSMTSPGPGSIASHVVPLSATASDNVGVQSVEFFMGGTSLGNDATVPYTLEWDSTAASNGAHTLTAVARDAAGNETTSAGIPVTTSNPVFVNETVVPGIAAATTIAFLPGGRMLVGELTERIWVIQPGATQPDPTPFLQLNASQLIGEQGLMDILPDPNFAQNGHYYVFYTRGAASSQNHNGVSRFTASGNGTVPGSEVRLWEDAQVAELEHHGGSLAFGADGKLYITYGDQFLEVSQQLNTPRGKVLRINKDGSIPTDNPFHDGAGPNRDEIWAYGLRNPFRMSVDPVSGTMYIGDVGGNVHSNAIEEVNIGVRGANYGWPQCQGNCAVQGTTDPIFSYPHSGRDSAITGGVVYRGSQFPSEYRGSYFFGDYVQNTVRRLTFDGDGNVSRMVNFWPADGTKDSATVGDPVKFVEGPDGSLYYVDIGFNDAHEPNAAAIRRIRYIAGNQPPTAAANANPTSGQAPLPVTFSSAGSSDPEGAPLTYSWTFGDGGTSTQANPSHTYQTAGQYTARLTVSDGANSTLSAAVTIRVGNPPTRDDPHARGQQLVPGRRRHQLLGERDGSRRRNVAGERVLLDDPLPPRHARAPLRRAVHEHEDRNAPDTDERTRLPRFDELRNRSDSHRLGRNNRIHLSDRRSGQGQPVIRHGSLRSDRRNRRNQQPSAVRPRRRQGLPSRHHRASASERRNLLHVRFVVGRRRAKPQRRSRTRTELRTRRRIRRGDGPRGSGGGVCVRRGPRLHASRTPPGMAIRARLARAGWIASGRFGNALLFNGTNARVTVGDSPSLDLTTAMTLEAWVFPTGGAGQWRDVIYKGPDDIYYLESYTSNWAAGDWRYLRQSAFWHRGAAFEHLVAPGFDL